MHDYEVMSRLNDLAGSLKGSYAELSTMHTRAALAAIQQSIQRKDEEMAWVDSCCLQLVCRTKGGKEETLTFQTDEPSVKKEWMTELRLAQLALDANNSPSAWLRPQAPATEPPATSACVAMATIAAKMPLFVRAKSVAKTHHQTEVSVFLVAISGIHWATQLLIHNFPRSDVAAITRQPTRTGVQPPPPARTATGRCGRPATSGCAPPTHRTAPRSPFSCSTPSAPAT